MRTVIAVILGALAIMIAVGQAAALLRARRRKRSYSLIPLVPAAIGVAACLIAPWKGSAYAIPIFLALDPTPIIVLGLLITGRLFK